MKLKYILSLVLATTLAPLLRAQNAMPVVSNVQTQADTLNNTVTITYDVADADGDPLEVLVRVSNDSGKVFLYSPANLTGDVGFPVQPGTGKQVVWTYQPGDFAWYQGGFMVRVVAKDRKPIDIQAIVDQVDSMRLRTDVYALEGVRHRTDGPFHLAITRDLIQNRLSAYGYPSWRDTFDFQGYPGENIVARKGGLTTQDTAYLVTGHYDSVIGSPGADDNATAVAGFLEVARVLQNVYLEKTVKFVGFDLEEEALNGAFDYAQNRIPNYETVHGVYNFEMLGFFSNRPNSQTTPFGFNLLFPDAYNVVAADSFRGNFITLVGSSVGPHVHESLERSAATYVPDLKLVTLVLTPTITPLATDLLRSDHAAFLANGIPAIMLTDGSNFRNPNYHQPTDTAGSLNYGFMAQSVKTTVGAICEMADAVSAGVAESPIFLLDVPLGTAPLAATKLVCVYPNPFGHSVNIDITLDKPAANVAVTIWDIQGRQVATLRAGGALGQGTHTLTWEPEDTGTGLDLSEGFYNLQVITDQQTQNIRLLHLHPHQH